MQTMYEDFLHYLWKTKKIAADEFLTTDGRKISILNYGSHNHDSGPDFFSGKIKLNDTIWAGNIEMHLKTSDWVRHGHSDDKAYENVILHVVYEDDSYNVKDEKLKRIPTLELKGKIPKIYLDKYMGLIHSGEDIACSQLIHKVDPAKINFWKYDLAIQRLHSKTEYISQILKNKNNDWEGTLYVVLARYFGAKVNTEPFETLAGSLPLSIISKNKNNSTAVEALIFGQAGMLEAQYDDPYYIELKSEYNFLRKKYQLEPIDAVAWKFNRMRPINFPTVRLAQFAALLQSKDKLFSHLLEAETPIKVREEIKSIPHSYWQTHYRFGVESKSLPKGISEGFIDLIIINTVAPILFLYGRHYNEQKFIDRSIQLLENIKPEINAITKQWKSLGVKIENAMESQALIHLKTNYCNHLRCMSCKIGAEIVS